MRLIVNIFLQLYKAIESNRFVFKTQADSGNIINMEGI